MSKSLNTYISELEESYNIYSVDTDFDRRYLQELIVDKRVDWFRKYYSKFQTVIPQIYYQTLPCVELEVSDQSECCQVASECNIIRSKEKLPDFISLADGELINMIRPNRVTAPNLNLIPYQRAMYWGNSRYNKTANAVFYYNGYIWVIGNNLEIPLLDNLTVRGVFRNPLDAGRFKTCEGKPCFSIESIYPMEEILWNLVKNDILTNDLKIKLAVNPDTEANTKDNVGDGQKKEG